MIHVKIKYRASQEMGQSKIYLALERKHTSVFENKYNRNSKNCYFLWMLKRMCTGRFKPKKKMIQLNDEYNYKIILESIYEDLR